MSVKILHVHKGKIAGAYLFFFLEKLSASAFSHCRDDIMDAPNTIYYIGFYGVSTKVLTFFHSFENRVQTLLAMYIHCKLTDETHPRGGGGV